MWIQISSGNGPAECERAVKLFFEKIISNYFKNNKLHILSSTQGEYKKDYRSILISLNITQSEANIFKNNYEGTIQWKSTSPYRPNHCRKNWFFNLITYTCPETNDYSLEEIKIERSHSSGPGGQNVNKVETAIKVIHVPTGITASASEERSQYMNKKLALARLDKRLKEDNMKKIKDKKNQLWNQHNNLIRGNPKKIYIGENFKLKE